MLDWILGKSNALTEETRVETPSVERKKIDIARHSYNDEIKKYIAKLNDWLQIDFINCIDTLFMLRGFQEITNLLTNGKNPIHPKLQRLTLIFHDAYIRPEEVVSLLKNPQCPVGLELVFINCYDAVENITLYESKKARALFISALENNYRVFGLSIRLSVEEQLEQIFGKRTTYGFGVSLGTNVINTETAQQIVAAINDSPVCEEIQFFQFESNEIKDAGFKLIANALSTRLQPSTPQKPKRLNLQFHRGEINPNDVITLLQHSNCPFGLSLAFIDCIDASTSEPLFSSKATHALFTTALDDNNKVIELIIDLPKESASYSRPISYIKVDNLSESITYNKRRFEILKTVEQENNQLLKQTIQSLLIDPTSAAVLITDKELRAYCNSSVKDSDLYHLFKVIAMCLDNNFTDAFKILSHVNSSHNPCTQEAAEILAQHLYGQLIIEEPVQKNGDDETARYYQELLNARNCLILLLLRRSRIRAASPSVVTFAPIANSCVRQLLTRSDAPTPDNPTQCLITYAELCRRIDKALYPQDYKFHKQAPNYFSEQFEYKKLSYLKNENVQQELQAKYGTRNVQVLEEIICRALTKPAQQCEVNQTPDQASSNDARLEFAEILKNMQNTFEQFFESMTIESATIDSTSTAAMAAAAAATCAATMQSFR